MYLNEKELKNWLKAKYPMLKDASGQFSPYDLGGPKSIVELKSRRGDRIFPDSQIEKQKFDKNMAIAKERNVDFYYIVFSEAHQEVYAWNVTLLDSEGYDFKWHGKMCPRTTDFESREYIQKEVGGLVWNKAHARWKV